MFDTYEEAVDFIFNIPKFTSKNEPEKTRAFLKRLGDVSDTIPCIHIAGTNGKGSVSAFVKAGLNACGYRVGTFVSPHLVDVRERFMIDDKMISKREFLNIANYIYNQIFEMREESGFSKYHPTFFEYLFFMAVVWFNSARPDFVVLETGMGGRLDATNSIKNPKVCIITEIGMDHMEYLGETKELIAAEKAGIIKPGVPFVFADREKSVSEVFINRAKEMNTPFFAVSKQNIKNYERSFEKIDFSMYTRYDELAFFALNTMASYQVENAMLAYEGISYLKDSGCDGIDLDVVRNGFSDMKWPGRMEKIADKLIVDGAHNEDGIKAFLESVSVDGALSRSLLYSAVSDKQIEEVVNYITGSRLFDRIYICHLDSYRAADTERIRQAFGETKVVICNTTAEALSVMRGDESEIKYVAGSLYLVGEVKALV